jgi:stearoyl-CoA desaturase (delta-9 desaturase)
MATATAPRELDQLRWKENAPFWILHGVAIWLAIWAGWSWQAFAWLTGMYALRMFLITGVYHRYYSHRAYKTSRVFQFLVALLCHITAQKGVLWWAAHHRNHHKYSDQPEDIHSPRQRGFWWSHMFWILAKRYRKTEMAKIPDFAKYPELVWLDKYEQIITIAFGGVFFLVGGLTALAWGFFVGIVLAWHATFTINSLAHVWGSVRYKTGDDSKNNVWLALLTGGEGWHNNHHHYQRSARQGFFWWEVDFTFYTLKTLELFRIVWDVEGVPDHVRDNKPAPGRVRLSDVETPPVTEPSLPEPVAT